MEMEKLQKGLKVDMMLRVPFLKLILKTLHLYKLRNHSLLLTAESVQIFCNLFPCSCSYIIDTPMTFKSSYVTLTKSCIFLPFLNWASITWYLLYKLYKSAPVVQQ
mmetsp:Transcript_26555/g.34267  ORF Transcript_26555/g.34267 Transcript_26555/m.34267 type:complete len:106 (+) Transcript_26555:2959-3276(+)